MKRSIPLSAILLFASAWPVPAHDGPPFPIITDQKVGPCVISLWTHPDIGNGTFWVIVDPPSDGSVPKDLKVSVAVQPVDQRIPERSFPASVDSSSSQLQYKVLIPFDRQEFVNARVTLSSAQASGSAAAKVEITPVGPQSRWELLLYLAPFLGAGFLWFRAAMRRVRPR